MELEKAKNDKPQRLKPGRFATLTARLKSCPDEASCDGDDGDVWMVEVFGAVGGYDFESRSPDGRVDCFAIA
jgi:hypothetical protein